MMTSALQRVANRLRLPPELPGKPVQARVDLEIAAQIQQGRRPRSQRWSTGPAHDRNEAGHPGLPALVLGQQRMKISKPPSR
jgi:hypothetical protein